MSKATSTILDYDDEDLLKFVDRRVGGEGHSPIWDLYDEEIDFFRNRCRSAASGISPRGSSARALSKSGGSSSSVSRLRTAITAKHGQAVVKVISYGRDKTSAKTLLDYISRKGELALEDRAGLLIEGLDDIAELADDWAASFDGNANSRNVVHLMLSAPIGTDRAAAHESVRDFARNAFAGNHDYVLVRHDDTDHPHTHILVQMRGDDGTKLDPRKADLKAWREDYARCALVHGIMLDASSRRSRGQGKKGQKMAVVKLKARGQASYAEIATAREVLEAPLAEHPGESAAQDGFEDERREFAKLGLALKEVAENEGQGSEIYIALLSRVHEYTLSMTVPEGMRAEFRRVLQNSGAVSAEGLVTSYAEAITEQPQNEESRSTGETEESRGR